MYIYICLYIVYLYMFIRFNVYVILCQYDEYNIEN